MNSPARCFGVAVTAIQFAVRHALAAFLLFPAPVRADTEAKPESVQELWADFDPRREALETEAIREWREDGGVFRQVRFLVGTFKGKPARMAAIYGFPDHAAAKVPAVMHIHGGGQRAFLHEVKFLVARGYAGLSVNWGGSGGPDGTIQTPETARPGDANTDWGAVNPSQTNVPGYSSMLPGPGQFFEDREHPKNNNWYLLTLGCRRGLTFLEQQPEVDGTRLGVHGYSMGGNLAMYVAGSDDRVKAAVPAVGGAGWRWQEHSFIGGALRQDHIRGDVEVFRRTMSFESYAPLIRCAVLHRSATNDFHGWMDDVYRTNSLIVGRPVSYSWSPHLNHGLAPAVAVTMPLWFDHFLKGGPALPVTPRSEVALAPEPVLRVTPAGHDWPVVRCEIFYSVDPDPRARFWRSAEVTGNGGAFSARLQHVSADAPLFAFANVFYALPQPVSLARLPGHPAAVHEVCISSLLHSHSGDDLKKAGVTAGTQSSMVIAEFPRDRSDWYALNEGNATHRQLWTRKITDPRWRGPDGAKLAITLKMLRNNRLSIVLQQNEWRSYRGPRRTFVCTRQIPGADAAQTLTLALSDFKTESGVPTSWAEMDQLGLCAHDAAKGVEAPLWNGPAPEFLRVEWSR